MMKKATLFGVCALAVSLAACRNNPANPDPDNHGLNRGQSIRNIESVDNPTTPGDNPAAHRDVTTTTANPDTAQMHRKITGNQLPNDQTNNNER